MRSLTTLCFRVRSLIICATPRGSTSNDVHELCDCTNQRTDRRPGSLSVVNVDPLTRTGWAETLETWEVVLMYEYSFISIPIKRRRDGSFTETDYRDTIREQAALGWEFVQAISFEGHANPHLDLVFQRKASS